MTDDALPVLKGTLELLALRALGGDEEMHGFQVLDWIHRTSGNALQIEEGALYPALHRMEKRGWLAARWDVSDRGRRAKFYRLTPKGRAALTEAGDRWVRYVEAVDRLDRTQEA